MPKQNKGKTSHEVLIDSDIYGAAGSGVKAWKQRKHLLSERLYADFNGDWPSLNQFRISVLSPDIIQAFCVIDSRIVSMGESFLKKEDPEWKADIGNMATLEVYNGQGYGTAVLDALIAESKLRWGIKNKNLRLTNHASKGNAEFYLKNGWEVYDTTMYRYKG